ncbi:diguanylate cyclase [Rhizobium sp. WL3]|uniref:GGDEF domain-containing protein n=1 Tax=Rhizobium sp. WL3 TaxID=2603277 RepID=UPI0011C20988|nr:diguanylate cyclase [Rhizobium sp. WL3]QEE44174.1 diguanylate cyclase [Rhizobium sp. WL3]
MLLQKLTLPILGADDETDPPWDYLAILYSIVPHLIAAVAILSASVLPYAEGQTTKVGIVTVILVMQVGLRTWGDYAYRRRAAHEPLKLWVDRFVPLSLVSGLAWGTALAILYTGGSPDTQVVVLAVGCGIVQSSAARAYLAPRSTLMVIVIVTAIVNAAAISEGNWIMVPICAAYVGFLASYMVRLIAMDEKRIAAERKTRVLVKALAESNAKLIQANEQLHRHARTDALTGLENRRGFDHELHRRLLLMRETGRPLALLLIDVDHFKRFNDANGHQAGDECLRTIAQLLAGLVTPSDDIAARYGGEEFAIILQDDEAIQAETFAEELRESVACLSLPTRNGSASTLTVSIGVAIAEPSDDNRTLIARADRRLYEAKAAGRDRVCASDRAEHLAGSR